MLYSVFTIPEPNALIRDARHAAGLSQAELAERLGVKQPVVARLERSGANPTVRTLRRVMDATGSELTLGFAPAPRGGSRLPDVDESQLRRRLAMTPAERLRTFSASQANLVDLLETARRAGR